MIKACSWSTPKFPHTSLDFVKALSINTDFFIPETPARREFPRELGPFGTAEFCCFLFPTLVKAPRLSAHSQASGIRKNAHSRALHTHYPSGQVHKPPAPRRSDRTESLPLHISVCVPPQFHPQTKQRLLLAAGRAEHGQRTHAAASPPALLPPRLEQHCTDSPNTHRDTIPGAGFLPSTTSGHPQSPLIHHQPAGGWVFRGLEELVAASCETSSVVSLSYSTALKALEHRCSLPYSLHFAPPGEPRPAQHGASPPWDCSRRSCHGVVLPFAIHEPALTALLQSQEIC